MEIQSFANIIPYPSPAFAFPAIQSCRNPIYIYPCHGMTTRAYAKLSPFSSRPAATNKLHFNDIGEGAKLSRRPYYRGYNLQGYIWWLHVAIKRHFIHWTSSRICLSINHIDSAAEGDNILLIQLIWEHNDRGCYWCVTKQLNIYSFDWSWCLLCYVIL